MEDLDADTAWKLGEVRNAIATAEQMHAMAEAAYPASPRMQALTLTCYVAAFWAMHEQCTPEIIADGARIIQDGLEIKRPLAS